MKNLPDFALKGTVTAQIALCDAFQKHPEKFIIAGRIMAFTGMMLIAEQALAGGLGDWANKFKSETLRPLLEFGMYGSYVGGVACSGVGVNKFIKLSKGDQQTTAGEGLGWTFGGGSLMGLGAIANGVGESMSAGGCAVGTYCGQ